MNKFKLQIVTPDGLVFDDEVENIILRTVNGDVGILAHHADYVASLEIGKAKVKIDGKYHEASCNGGTLTVTDGKVRVIAFSFEWADEIDVQRAFDAKKRAEEAISKKKSDYDVTRAKIKLKRALSRINVAQK